MFALIEAGADVNARTEGRDTTLHAAARWNNNPAVVFALIEAGADVNARTWNGKTLLHVAARRNENPAVVSALIEAALAAGFKDWQELFELAKENDALRGTDVYWRLNDLRFDAGR